MKRLLVIIPAMILFAFSASATHIFGGTITYVHLGDSTYAVTLRLYRDCQVGNPLFASTATIIVRDQNGNAFNPSRNLSLPLHHTSPVPSYLPCAGSASHCFEEGVYTDTVSKFPARTGGYHLYHQYCCRPTTTGNLNPPSQGLSVYTRIPDQNLFGSNTSPDWNLSPPFFVCQGWAMNFNSGATDADGDSLVYSYYTPYTDANPTFPSGNATFTNVNWANGFSATNPCGGAALTMNAQSGLITGTPATQGFYAAGVKCEEYRNGIKIGEVLRDYPFLVIPCPPQPSVTLGQPQLICLFTTMQYTCVTTSASTYFWDFGDPQITGDTSSLSNPSWLYAQPGVYTVTLIINRNTACADTATQQITVEQVFSSWTNSGNAYASIPIQFTDNSYTTTGAPIVMWDWDFGDSSPHSNLQNPVHTYAATGNYNVVLSVLSASGCTDTLLTTLPVLTPNSLSEIFNPAFSIYPNPSDGNFTITLKQTVHDGQLRIRDIQGKTIYSGNISASQKTSFHLTSTPGIYFAEFITPESCSVQKLIIR